MIPLMIPDYLSQIQRQIIFEEGLTINYLYDDQICHSVSPEVYNYLLYKYICLGYNYLYAMLDFRPNPVLLVPDPEDPIIGLNGYQDFVPLHLFLETPNQPLTQLCLLVAKS